jgi:hypothetical protein
VSALSNTPSQPFHKQISLFVILWSKIGVECGLIFWEIPKGKKEPNASLVGGEKRVTLSMYVTPNFDNEQFLKIVQILIIRFPHLQFSKIDIFQISHSDPRASSQFNGSQTGCQQFNFSEIKFKYFLIRYFTFD